MSLIIEQVSWSGVKKEAILPLTQAIPNSLFVRHILAVKILSVFFKQIRLKPRFRISLRRIFYLRMFKGRSIKRFDHMVILRVIVPIDNQWFVKQWNAYIVHDWQKVQIIKKCYEGFLFQNSFKFYLMMFKTFNRNYIGF